MRWESGWGPGRTWQFDIRGALVLGMFQHAFVLQTYDQRRNFGIPCFQTNPHEKGTRIFLDDFGRSCSFSKWQFDANSGWVCVNHPTKNANVLSSRKPSGKLRVCYWKWPIEIADLPVKNGDVPLFFGMFTRGYFPIKPILELIFPWIPIKSPFIWVSRHL